MKGGFSLAGNIPKNRDTNRLHIWMEKRRALMKRHKKRIDGAFTGGSNI